MFAIILAAAAAVSPASPSPPSPVSDPCSFSQAAQAKGTPACTVDSRPATATPPAIPVQCAGQPKDAPAQARGRCVRLLQRQADGSQKTMWLWQPFAKPDAHGK